MTSNVLLLTIFLLLSPTYGDEESFPFYPEENEYCSINCSSGLHIACKESPCELVHSCPTDAKFEEVTGDIKKLIVELHNEIRDTVALGNDIRLPGLKASDMKAMSYSEELQFLAECWANTCSVEEPACLTTKKYNKIGKTLVYVDRHLEIKTLVEESIQAWYDEISNIDKSTISNFKPDEKWNMLTQIIWSGTKFVGCGCTYFGEGSFLVCLYGPAGNIVGEPIFRIGEPCSNCTEKCNRFFTGLCGKSKVSDDWKNTFRSSASLETTVVFTGLLPVSVLVSLLLWQPNLVLFYFKK